MGKEQELRPLLTRAEKALTPFANAVFNDNGDLTISTSMPSSDEVTAAYFVRRDIRHALGRRSSSDEQAEVVAWRGKYRAETKWQYFDHPFDGFDPDKYQLEPLTLASPSGVKAGVTEIADKIVKQAMLDAWNDICSDTGCYPIDITNLGFGKLAFSPHHWASSTAMHIRAALGVSDEGMEVDARDASETHAVPTGRTISLPYTNWRGEFALRTIIPMSVWFGTTEWHPKPGWLLTAWDESKRAPRDFALDSIGYPASTPPIQGDAK